MTTLVACLVRKDGLSKEEFKDYYESTHCSLLLKHFGHLVASYTRYYLPAAPRLADTEYGRPPDDGGPDVITELRFNDQAAFETFMAEYAKPEVHEIFLQDMLKFMDLESSRGGMAEVCKADL